jgi:DNA mismatch repair protein MSH6
VPLINSVAQSFKKLNRGLKALENSAEDFKSKNIPGLLRSAPDLMPNIKHVQEMFVQAEKEKGSGMNLLHLPPGDDNDTETS